MNKLIFGSIIIILSLACIGFCKLRFPIVIIRKCSSNMPESNLSLISLLYGLSGSKREDDDCDDDDDDDDDEYFD